MKVSFANVKVGIAYSRHQLADLWGYKGYEALARGLVTPRGDNKLILFITEGDKQQQSIQKYVNHFDGRTLEMEGPEDHFGEARMLNADSAGDEIHLFHRVTHEKDFTYYGKAHVVTSQLHRDRPSQFTLEIV